MSLALDEARSAWLMDEIPVGAVAISWARNRKEEKDLALAHGGRKTGDSHQFFYTSE